MHSGIAGLLRAPGARVIVAMAPLIGGFPGCICGGSPTNSSDGGRVSDASMTADGSWLADAGTGADASPAPDSGTAFDAAGGADSGADGGPLDSGIDAGSPVADGGGLVDHCTHQGATLYVSPTGADTNNGTQASPLATLTAAANLAAPGDTVWALPGAYSPKSRETLGSKGTAKAWICFEPAPDGGATLDGTQIPQDDLVLLTGQYIVFRGFEIRNATSHGIESRGGQSIDIVSNTIHDSQGAAISLGTNTSITATTGIEVHGNTAYNNGLGGTAYAPDGGASTWPAIVRSYGASGIAFTDNLVYENWGEGVDFILTDGGLASGNTIYDNYSVNLYLDNASNITVSRNFIYWSGDPQFVRHDDHHGPTGIQLAQENHYTFSVALENEVIVDNVIVNCTGGILYGNYQGNGGLHDSVVAGNTVYAVDAGLGTLTIQSPSPETNVRAFDNIFVGSNVVAPGDAGVSYDHNLFFHSAPGAAQSPSDPTGDPLFSNGGGLTPSDYQIQNGSPAAGAGVASTDLSVDFSGQARPTPPSVGAWEPP
jgi:hypothetical protein